MSLLFTFKQDTMAKRKRNENEEEDEFIGNSPGAKNLNNKNTNLNRNSRSPAVVNLPTLQGLTAKVDLQEIRKKLLDKQRPLVFPHAIVVDPAESKPYKV